MKKIIAILCCFILSLSFFACGGPSKVPIDPEDPGTEQPTEPEPTYRKARDFTLPAKPDNKINENELQNADEKYLVTIPDGVGIVNGFVRLDFKLVSGKYILQLVSLKKLLKAGEGIERVYSAAATADSLMVDEKNPVKVYVKAVQPTPDLYSGGYDKVEKKNYGYLATASFKTANGSSVTAEDRYYFAKENETDTFNVRKAVIFNNVNWADKSFESIFSLETTIKERKNSEWFMPNRMFKNYSSDGNGEATIKRETQLGLPMVMVRDSVSGFTVSSARYQPKIHYEDNSVASISAISYSIKEPTLKPTLEIAYPSKDGSRKYHEILEGAKHVFDISIRGEFSENYNKASSNSYNAHFNLQNQRIVDTDIDEVYKVINEDFKAWFTKTKNTKYNYYSYGLPWNIKIQNGAIGPQTYQAGFVGQQIPAGYNMMLYGLMNNDLISLQNGINLLDFWVEDSGFMQVSGVPKIWYDTWDNDFRSYPTFLRMAVDAMEGLLDAYRLASAHGISRDSWGEALTMFADFLVTRQNTDGSWYRCYNYDGEPFKDGDNGVAEPPNDICQSTSKANTPMPIRFLGKMYEMTEDLSYKQASIKGGDYVYKILYPTGVYQGGTCDNPNKIDKEAGVYAMYCYDALYTLTKDVKWIECLKQATAFTMSTCQSFSFPVKNASNLKSGYALQFGYNDGVSFISSLDNGIDNYIAYIYYQLFRIYVITGEETYLKQAEFIQQNTKSIMDWDGALKYPFKSLVAEASTIWSFGFSTVDNGVWLPWSSVANAEPISKMITNFGNADVATFSKTPMAELRTKLNEIGVGGYGHKVYENTVVENLEK